MTTKTIDVILNMQPKRGSIEHTTARIAHLKQGLEAIEKQADKTRNKMEKLSQVGNRMAATGALIVAPFALAVNKYLESQKEVLKTGGKMEKNAAALVELQKEWADAQIEVGKVATEILLPYLTKAVDLVKQIAEFAKEHPGAVKAALGIGASMVVVGGAISALGTIVSTLATIQGLAAGVLGANATAAAGVSAAGLTSGMSAAFLAVMTNPLTWAVAGLVLVKPIMNYLLGTNQTWADIRSTGYKLLVVLGFYVDKAIRAIGTFFSGFGKWIAGGFASLASAIRGLFGGTKDSGGMIGKGVFANAGSPEFVMSHSTTKAAESLVGGSLTQQKLLQALAGGGSRRITYQDNRRIDSSLSPNQRRQIANDTLSILSGAL